MSKVKILGAVTSESGVTLYLDNGDELNLPKDTQKTKDILDQMVDALKKQEHVEIDLSTYSIEKSIEEKTNGVVKFVRGRFSQLKAMFGGTVEEPAPKMTTVVLGTVKPLPADPAPVQQKGTTRFVPQQKGPAVEIETEELHAVVNNKVIPGVEMLTPYMDAINKGEDAIGFQRFMERIATVIDRRSHSVKELLHFMSKGDLPIADDGCIVGYKVLVTAANNDGFVDRHSHKVKQKLGSFVQMDEKLIDPNRRNECSTGLHIARRGYLGGFHGNIICLVKVAPEDVIAVPPGEPDKMRAKAYHIVAVLPADVHPTLRSGKPMTSNDKASKLLADVVKGNHTPVLEIVNIGAARGGDVTITPVEGAKKMARAAVGTSGTVKALDDRPPAPEEAPADVSIRELRKRVDEVTTKRVKPSKKVQAAAKSGDLSVAINEVVKKTPPKKKPTLVSIATKEVVVNASGDVVSEKKVDKKALALKLHAEGKSNRQIEAEIHMCRKTLKKLFDANGLKPNG